MRKYADGEEGRGEDEAWWFVQDPNKPDGRRVMEGSPIDGATATSSSTLGNLPEFVACHYSKPP
jgi:hypothetical protein